MTAGGSNSGRNMWALTAGICTMLESTICTRDLLTTLDSFQVMNVECCAYLCFVTLSQMGVVKNGFILPAVKRYFFVLLL